MILYDLNPLRVGGSNMPDEVNIPHEILQNEVSRVIVSKKGLFGFVSKNVVKVLDVQYDNSGADSQSFSNIFICRTRTTHTLAVKSTYSIMKDGAEFGSNGTWLCVWATPPNRYNPSHCYLG